MNASSCPGCPTSQLPACGLENHQRTTQSLGTLHPYGRHRRNSWLLALHWGSALAVVATTAVKQQMEDFSLCLSSLRKIYFPIKKQIFIFKKVVVMVEKTPLGMLTPIRVPGLESWLYF